MLKNKILSNKILQLIQKLYEIIKMTQNLINNSIKKIFLIFN